MNKSTTVYGIVGGLGAEASAKLYLDLVHEIIAFDKTRYPAVLLWNIPITKEDDEALMQSPKEVDNVVFSLLKDGIERLLTAGASVIGIPCNTVHFVMHRLPKYDDVTLLNIVDCVVAKVKTLNIPAVGLLATKTTVSSGLYSNPLTKNGTHVVTPSEEDQDMIMEIIFKVLENKNDARCKDELKRIIMKMEVKWVILGCTELPLVLSQSDIEDVFVIDSLAVLKDSMISRPCQLKTHLFKNKEEELISDLQVPNQGQNTLC